MAVRTVKKLTGDLIGRSGEKLGEIEFDAVIGDRGNARGQLRADFGVLQTAMEQGRSTIQLSDGVALPIIIKSLQGTGVCEFLSADPWPDL